MELKSQREVINTRAKLADLEAHYETLRSERDGNQRLRELSMRSLKKLINQFKGEIARYEARQAASARQ